jgi:hypothetical protein
MRIWEAVYRKSDLVIMDEVDRIQVIFDQFFAPTQILADHTGKSCSINWAKMSAPPIMEGAEDS